MNTEEILSIRRAAFQEAIALAETSDSPYDNGTGHQRGGWRDGRRDIIKMIEKHMEQDAERWAATAAAA